MPKKLDFWIISRAPAMPYLPFIIFPRAKSVENIEAESLLIDMEATLMVNSSYELHKKQRKKFNNPFLFIDALSIFAKSLCLKQRQKNPFIPEYEFSAFQSKKKVDENSRPFITQKLIYRQSPFFRYFSSAHFNHPLERKTRREFRMKALPE